MKVRRLRWVGVLLVAAWGAGLSGCSRSAPARPEADDDGAKPVVRGQQADDPKQAGKLDPALGLRGFTLPDDKGGRLLVQELRHPDRVPATPKLTPHGRPLPPPRPLNVQDSYLPPAVADAPALPSGPPLVARQPRPVLDEPFPDEDGGVTVPERPHLLAGAPVRLPSPDPSRPPRLPYLAGPQPDRAPLDDATAEASRSAALTKLDPRRTQPAPFLRLTLPDPFEHRHVVEVRLALAEDATPPSASPRPPQR